MHTSRVRKVGGSAMLAIPPPLLDALNLKPGDDVVLTVDDAGHLVVAPRARPRYSRDELLAQCHPKARRTTEDRTWFGAKPAGRELP